MPVIPGKNGVYMSLCECGCGLDAPISKCSNTRQGTIKGKPQRFIRGHNNIKSHVDYIIDKNGCWIWQRAIAKSGYGTVTVNGKTRSAHRVAYEIANGDIPVGFQVHHTCRNRPCVNPEHLVALSPANHKRQDHSKLTKNDIERIKFALSVGGSVRKIADEFGVNHCTIRDIQKGRSWQ